MVAALASGTEAVKEMKTGSNLKKSANRPALNLLAEVTNIFLRFFGITSHNSANWPYSSVIVMEIKPC